MTDQKSVLILFSDSEIGGAEVSLSRMAASCEATDYHIGTIGTKGAWSQWASNQGLSPIIFGGGSFGLLGSTLSALRYAKNHKIDIIYICGFRVSVMIRLLSLFISAPKFVSGIRWNPNSQSRLDRFFRKIERFLKVRMSHYIANANATKSTLLETIGLSPSKASVIYNGVDMAKLADVTAHDYQTKNRVVLVPANLSERKGHVPFLDIIEQIVQTQTNVAFYFMGRDEQNGLVQCEIKRRELQPFVHCIGYQADALSYIAGADLVVLPSLYGEGCPTSLLEALGLKVPVVAYDIDGISEIISHEKDGYLCEMNTDDMTANILKLIDSAELRETMGEFGNQKVTAKFTLDVMAKQHHDIWQSLN